MVGPAMVAGAMFGHRREHGARRPLCGLNHLHRKYVQMTHSCNEPVHVQWNSRTRTTQTKIINRKTRVHKAKNCTADTSCINGRLCVGSARSLSQSSDNGKRRRPQRQKLEGWLPSTKKSKSSHRRRLWSGQGCSLCLHLVVLPLVEDDRLAAHAATAILAGFNIARLSHERYVGL